MTGVAQRTISSAAVAGRSFLYSSHWSGLFANAIMPWVIELRVVSLPATASMITKKPNSSSESFSPSMSAWISVVTMSSVGFLPRSSAIFHGVHDQLHRRLRGIDVGVLRVLATGHLVGPAEQLVAVLLRHAQQAGDRLQRQLARHLLDEVAGALGRRGLGDFLGALASSSCSRPIARGVKPAGDDLAQPGVVRRVHVEHDAALQVDLSRASCPAATPGWRRSASWRRCRCGATPL